MSRDIWYGISKPRQVQIKAAVAMELEQQLEEKRALIEVEVRSKFLNRERERLRGEVKAEIREEIARGTPTNRERLAFVTFVRGTEEDALALARVASRRAEKTDRTLLWGRRLRGPLPGLLFLGALPALWAAFILTLLPWGILAGAALLLAFVILVCNLIRFDRLRQQAEEARKRASDYLIIAERARAYRQVDAERLESKQKIDQLAAQLQRDKERVDERFHPCVQELTEAKCEVRRQRFEVDLDDLDKIDDRWTGALTESAEDAGMVEGRVR